MNPFVRLESDIRRLEAEKAKVEKLYLQLRQSNANLVNENITLENALVAAKDSIGEMCDKCSFQTSQACRKCALYGFATEHRLWKEVD